MKNSRVISPCCLCQPPPSPPPSSLSSAPQSSALSLCFNTPPVSPSVFRSSVLTLPSSSSSSSSVLRSLADVVIWGLESVKPALGVFALVTFP